MTGLTKYLVLFSIGLNCLFLVAFIFLVVRKWNSISDRLRDRFFGIQPTEKVLATFNREPYQFVNEKEIFDEADFNKVDTPDPSYRLKKEKKKSANWV